MKKYITPITSIPIGLYEKALPVALLWPERLAFAAQAGYASVEISIDDTDERLERLDWNRAQRISLRNAAFNLAVPIKSLSLSSHRRFPLGSASTGTRQKALDILKKGIDLSLDLGVRYILIAGADDYYNQSTDLSKSRFLEGLECGFERASASGLVMALENWDVGVNSLSRALWYVRYFASPWFQLYADIGNLAYLGYDPLPELEAARGHIAGIHLKDTLLGQLRYVPLGEGIVPFAACFAKLAEIGYFGPAILELWTESDPRALEIVREARGWIQARLEEGWQMVQHKFSRGVEEPDST